MLEDRLLIWKLKNGHAEGLIRAYGKYKNSRKHLLVMERRIIVQLRRGQIVTACRFLWLAD